MEEKNMDNVQLPELPNDLAMYLDKPYGGLFEDKVQIEIIEEIVADPYCTYKQQYFEEMTGETTSNIIKALNNLVMLDLIEKDKDDNNLPIYRANLKSKKLVALTLLSLAIVDDRDGTECMNSAILDYYFKILKGKREDKDNNR